MKKIMKKIVTRMSRYLGMTYSATKEYYLSVDETKELQGKVALVTGGAGALGRAICLHLAANGAIVYVGGRNNDTLQKAVLEIEGINGTAYPLVIDVMSEKSIENAVEQIMSETRKIDILVNCAGGSAREKWTTLDKQDINVIDMVLNSNLRGTILCTKYTAAHMIEQRSGKIINIASTTGIQGNACNGDYAAAKSGVIGFTKSLAQELGEYGINVNCVSPGYIQTGKYDLSRAEYLKRTNFLRTIGEPEDIAAGVEFLVSKKAKFITGINLVIDGGRSLGLHTFNC